MHIIKLSKSSIYKRERPKKTSTARLATEPDQEVISVYIDGACEGNHQKNASFRRGGYGVWFGDGDERNFGGRLPGIPTNNRAELYSLLALFKFLKKEQPNYQQCFYKIYTDSKYTCTVVSQVDSWQKKGWKNASRKTPENIDLVRELHEEKPNFNFHMIHVAGHAGIIGNEGADSLARQGCNSEVEATTTATTL